jgi:hypothetical protein
MHIELLSELSNLVMCVVAFGLGIGLGLLQEWQGGFVGSAAKVVDRVRGHPRLWDWARDAARMTRGVIRQPLDFGIALARLQQWRGTLVGSAAKIVVPVLSPSKAWRVLRLIRLRISLYRRASWRSASVLLRRFLSCVRLAQARPLAANPLSNPAEHRHGVGDRAEGC